eukprot:GHVU01090802.1.p3 GENE.GHVU01090802.1~~GHVU01090802.1.p3  ORF type:complete len:196 (-),score=15.15 GHVU01090802.1:779-1366(-)
MSPLLMQGAATSVRRVWVGDIRGLCGKALVRRCGDRQRRTFSACCGSSSSSGQSPPIPPLTPILRVDERQSGYDRAAAEPGRTTAATGDTDSSGSSRRLTSVSAPFAPSLDENRLSELNTLSNFRAHIARAQRRLATETPRPTYASRLDGRPDAALTAGEVKDSPTILRMRKAAVLAANCLQVAKDCTRPGTWSL